MCIYQFIKHEMYILEIRLMEIREWQKSMAAVSNLIYKYTCAQTSQTTTLHNPFKFHSLWFCIRTWFVCHCELYIICFFFVNEKEYHLLNITFQFWKYGAVAGGGDLWRFEFKCKCMATKRVNVIHCRKFPFTCDFMRIYHKRLYILHGWMAGKAIWTDFSQIPNVKCMPHNGFK